MFASEHQSAVKVTYETQGGKKSDRAEEQASRKGDRREERAQGSAQKDYVMARIDGPRKGGLVAVQAAENLLEQSRRASTERRGGFAVAVEFEEPGEKWEDKGEGGLRGGRWPTTVSHGK